MSDVFRFKQFAVDQTGCAMKVNTDGVLLGATAQHTHPKHILDIGTGTGVIALMLAQRFPGACIDAVEIDQEAADSARGNFAQSSFNSRLHLMAGDFRHVLALKSAERKYDLIVSNPPFYLDALHSPKAQKTMAKHADESFFEDLIQISKVHLSPDGLCWFILPANTNALVAKLAMSHGLYPQQSIFVKSFRDSEPHRIISAYGLRPVLQTSAELVIYDEPKVYTQHYQELLKDFLIIF